MKTKKSHCIKSELYLNIYEMMQNLDLDNYRKKFWKCVSTPKRFWSSTTMPVKNSKTTDMRKNCSVCISSEHNLKQKEVI